MKRRFRLTGFARFFIVMLFVVPLAYIIASYYNGEDGLENIRRIVGLDKTEQVSEPVSEPVSEDTVDRVTVNNDKARTGESDRISLLEQDNVKLKAQLLDMSVELKELRADIDRLEALVNKRRN